MTKVQEYRLPCPNPKCNSSDAFHIWEDGHGYCFSCKEFFSKRKLKSLENKESFSLTNEEENDTLFIVKKNKKRINISNTISRTKESLLQKKEFVNTKMEAEKEKDITYKHTAHRGITKDTMKFFGVITKIEDGEPVALSFPQGDKAMHVRRLDSKEFYAKGEIKDAPLFGMDKFPRGSGKAVTVTEGRLDAMSVFQMLGSKYPVVSLGSASTAKRDSERYFEYFNSFERLYLCFDNDEVGKSAVTDFARSFDPNKIYHVNLDTYKDANEYLQDGATDQFVKVWWNAKRFLPKGIVSSFDDIDKIINEEEAQAKATYPFSTLQRMSYGIRTGELILFTALEGIGKTEVLRAIEYHLLKTTDDNIGIIHLEEKEKRSVQGLVGYELKVPVHLPDCGVSPSDMVAAYRKLVVRDDRLHFYSHFGTDDPDVILDIIRYMASVLHCRYIFLDHITMLVTGYEGDDDERRKLDYISTRLAMMTRELDFCLFLVSHVNDDGKTRGSRNISKVADANIYLDRDIEALDRRERNKTKLLVKKAWRYTGQSGPAGVLTFDPNTFMIQELTDETIQGSGVWYAEEGRGKPSSS